MCPLVLLQDNKPFQGFQRTRSSLRRDRRARCPRRGLDSGLEVSGRRGGVRAVHIAVITFTTLQRLQIGCLVYELLPNTATECTPLHVHLCSSSNVRILVQFASCNASALYLYSLVRSNSFTHLIILCSQFSQRTVSK